MSQSLTTIPLSKLVPSPVNVRKTDTEAGLDELAASIEAHGLLQNLTVRPSSKEAGKPGTYEVIAGGRRLAALKLLAKRKRIAKNYGVPCRVLKDGDPVEVSLAENVVRAPVHPADQFEAFSALRAQGLGAEEIATRFGVTAAAVVQRLKLAAVSSRLMAVYRDGGMTLDQLTAFTVSDDHAAQERVWFECPWELNPSEIRKALTAALVPGTDRRARFVGADAYQAAGGTIIRDLFDEKGAGYFADRELLDRLAAEKLATVAAPVEAEGWVWIEVAAEVDYEHHACMGRIPPTETKLPEDAQAKLDDLTERYNTLATALGDDPPEDGARELERLSDEIDALTEQGRAWSEKDRARAGVLIALDADGNVRIERGLLKPEARRAEERARRREEREQSAPGGVLLSDALVEDLTAHQTAALRAVVGENPPLALAALVHALALSALYSSARITCLSIRCDSPNLGPHAPGIGEGKAFAAIADRDRRWRKILPGEESLWRWLLVQSPETQMGLLAHCVAATVDTVQRNRPGDQPDQLIRANALARAAKLDMADWWAPTKDRYLGRVPKALILAAVAESVSKSAADNIAKLKKEPLVLRAEELLAGRRWLPEILRTPAESVPGEKPESEANET